MTKTEQLGRLFVMELNCISNDHHIKLKDVLGKPMTIEMDLPEGYARVRMEEHGALQQQCQGEGNARGLAVGHLFSLNEAAAPDWRDEQNREYLITSATHELRLEESTEQEDSYEIRFTAIDSKVPFRPQRITPKPTVRGIQTAIVCGPKGEEIWTDEYGRVKVHFHWDRYGKYDENASCWIRVAQIWAGKNWGGMYMPRVGQEVVVDFLEGDPDRPLITGRVYNDEFMTPYELPAEMTKSTIKSHSTKEGTPDNFNMLRFDDKSGGRLAPTDMEPVPSPEDLTGKAVNSTITLAAYGTEPERAEVNFRLFVAQGMDVAQGGNG